MNQFPRIMHGFLFPRLQEELGSLPDKHPHLIAAWAWFSQKQCSRAFAEFRAKP
jgi:hypothetical protein